MTKSKCTCKTIITVTSSILMKYTEPSLEAPKSINQLKHFTRLLFGSLASFYNERNCCCPSRYIHWRNAEMVDTLYLFEVPVLSDPHWVLSLGQLNSVIYLSTVIDLKQRPVLMVRPQYAHYMIHENLIYSVRLYHVESFHFKQYSG